MRFLIRKYFVFAVSLFTLKELIPALAILGSWKEFFYASLILALLFLIFKPIANLIALPINILTLNLFSWIINILVFYLWTLIVPGVKIGSWQVADFSFGPIAFKSFTFEGFQVLVIAAIVLTVIIQFFDWLIR